MTVVDKQKGLQVFPGNSSAKENKNPKIVGPLGFFQWGCLRKHLYRNS